MSKKRRQALLIVLAAAVLAGIAAVVLFLNKNDDSHKAKVGYIMTGKADESGWNGMNYKGIEAVCSKFELELVLKENILENTGMCAEAVSELAEDGAELIILSSYGYPSEVRTLIEQYPDIAFYGNSADYYSENMSSYFGRMYQARYLSGIIAGMVTESNKIGYVAAMANDEVNRGINAFTLGVRRVNPEAEVTVEWTGNWDDEENAVIAAEKLIREGADLLTYHQNKDYVAAAADKAGIYSIGYNEAVEGLSEKYLTAAVWDWEQLYGDIVRDFMQGKANARQHHWCGIETGAVTLSEFSPLVTDEIKSEIERAREEIISGNDVFSGEIYDNRGNLMCSADEAISDTALMGSFDWYVNGVIINE